MDAAPSTLDAYLDEWFALQRTRVEPSTWESYATSLRAYVRPYLGQAPLDALTVRALDLHYVRLLESGGRHGQPLAARTVGYAHAILRKALNDAVVAGLLAENVALRATVPRLDPDADPVPARVAAWNEEQAQRFLQLCVNHELADLWQIALGTGMRRGELLGLRWEDVDLAVPQIRVSRALAFTAAGPRLKAPKSGRGRTLFLDDDTAAVIARQPRRQGPWPLVFAGPDGGPLLPSWVSDRWRYQWPGLDLPRIRLHDLRHTHATLLQRCGVASDASRRRMCNRGVALI